MAAWHSDLTNILATHKKAHTNTQEQVILIPQRFSNTPTAKELALVAGNRPFQSPSCLLQCKKPTDFVSVSWDKKVNSCSYAKGKQPLE